MTTIEIDFDVFKELTVRRATENVTYNDVLRQVLGLSPVLEPVRAAERPSAGGWTTKGVTFPEGTEFRASYRGQAVLGKVQAGLLMVNGQGFDSASSAAGSVTGTSVNGWIFWECRLPGKTTWQLMKTMRK